LFGDDPRPAMPPCQAPVHCAKPEILTDSSGDVCEIASTLFALRIGLRIGL